MAFESKISELSKSITVVIVSSYSPFHPDTFLIDSVIESLRFFPGLCDCSKVIVLDGYNLVVGPDPPEIKRGKLTKIMADKYELYCQILLDRYNLLENVTIIKSELRIGFAFAVKKALEIVTTPFAMLLQHDRTFCTPMPSKLLSECMNLININDYIRYIGFPTSRSRSHVSQIASRYVGLGCVNHWDNRIHLNLDGVDAAARSVDNDNNYYGYFLQPSIFWFDSNHLCHVERYLNIFRPYKTVPPELKNLLGNKRVKELLLRQGDFIEDRWGQMQRKILTDIIPTEVKIGSAYVDCGVKDIPCYTPFLVKTLRWFGSYLVWQTDKDHIAKLTELTGLENGNHSSSHLLAGVTTSTNGFVVDSCNFSRVFVRHLNGRRKPSSSSTFYTVHESDGDYDSDNSSTTDNTMEVSGSDDITTTNVIRSKIRATENLVDKTRIINKSDLRTTKPSQQQQQLDNNDWTDVSLHEDVPLDVLFQT